MKYREIPNCEKCEMWSAGFNAYFGEPDYYTCRIDKHSADTFEELFKDCPLPDIKEKP